MSFGSDGGGDLEAVPPLQLSSSDSYSHVSYSCGSCGYELNLSSCNRNIPMINSEYGKSMKRGVISFFSVDESRFTQINKHRWLPYFPSWRLFQRQTKLLCRGCRSYIGTAWNVEDGISTSPYQLVKQGSMTWDGISARMMYEIKIRSLRPVAFTLK
ncbi:hypothetical protein SASPL_113856 [Salvia splendens]|uniref:Uncharacterized protein n=1 Tax=Salvia splendens TaxID=180675 RepID=A0A8X8Y0R9_SALSN|nr:uncharacterized protein At4g08330, chloroplastic-like [Salvia splendens]KAG6423460.1 hypothetical protein SASPL_113856 [Salvia splendens]